MIFILPQDLSTGQHLVFLSLDPLSEAFGVAEMIDREGTGRHQVCSEIGQDTPGGHCWVPGSFFNGIIFLLPDLLDYDICVMSMFSSDPHKHVVFLGNCSSDFASVSGLHPADEMDPGSVILDLVELKSIRAEENSSSLLGMFEVGWNRKIHLPDSQNGE